MDGSAGMGGHIGVEVRPSVCYWKLRARGACALRAVQGFSRWSPLDELSLALGQTPAETDDVNTLEESKGNEESGERTRTEQGRLVLQENINDSTFYNT